VSKVFSEGKRDIPVYGEFDVVVCGGGPAGVTAAVAAGRAGGKVLLVEQTNCMGGISTAGGHNHLCLYSAWHKGDERIVGGIPFEAVQRTVEMGYGIYRNGNADYELEGMKLALEQMAAGANVKMLYHTLFADALVRDGRMIGVAIQNKSGRQAVLARQVIDATGDADVAASAGCPWEKGRPGDGACQPTTLMFTIGGVDWPRVQAHWTREKDWKFRQVWKRAQEAGDMEPFQSVVMGFWHTPTRPDQLGINFTHIVGIDCTSADDITRATIEGRRQAFHMIPVFRKYIEGMENCYLISTASLLGTRESRRIVGDHVLTDVELLKSTPFDDSICWGSFYIDIHNCTGPGMDPSSFNPEPGFKYQIPYRCLAPKGVENLLVAGRCISVTHRALGSTRVMPQCAAMGEAAGVAAMISIKDGCTARAVNISKLQDALRANGAIFDEKGVIHGQSQLLPPSMR
jgi:hypothetical protein